MDELTIQHMYVMEYLCRREDEGGLGYRNTSNNIVSNDLFIPSHLAEFVSLNAPNEWKRLLKKYDYDEQALQTALKEAVKASSCRCSTYQAQSCEKMKISKRISLLPSRKAATPSRWVTARYMASVLMCRSI